MDGDWITVGEAAEILQVAQQTVLGLIKRGRLAVWREFNRKPYVLRGEVEARAAGIDPDPRLTVKQVAERLGVSGQTVLAYIKRGNLIDGEKGKNGEWRFTEEALAKFIAPVPGLPTRRQPANERRLREQ